MDGQYRSVRQCLVGLGFVLIALTPLVGPIPGPGGIIVFGAGLSLVLKYTGWAKRLYVRFKRRHPNKGRWADWSLRRASARRREEIRKQSEADRRRLRRLTFGRAFPIRAPNEAAQWRPFSFDPIYEE